MAIGHIWILIEDNGKYRVQKKVFFNLSFHQNTKQLNILKKLFFCS